MQRSEAVIDLDAIRDNVARLRRTSSGAALMAVVKADGYGHGMLPAARAALAGGAAWLGVAMLEEAIELRRAGIDAPTLAWLWTPGEADALAAAIAADVDVSASAPWAIELIADIAADLGRPARVHLKIDTGLSRNGATADDWPDLLSSAGAAGRGRQLDVVGIWSHFAYADEPEHPTIARQIERFEDALDVAKRAGIEPQVRHIANSAATLTLPHAHYDLVRPGIAIYGLSPFPADRGPLTPAMQLRSHVALAKRLRAGEGVSYGHQYTTAAPTTAALVPLGYADGIPRAASNVGPLAIGGRRYTISGRVCMDQFVVDVGDAPIAAGDDVLLFGSGRDGEPTAQDWADAIDTIHYEIVTRVGARVPRRYVGEPELVAAASAAAAAAAAAAPAADAAAVAPAARAAASGLGT